MKGPMHKQPRDAGTTRDRGLGPSFPWKPSLPSKVIPFLPFLGFVMGLGEGGGEGGVNWHCSDGGAPCGGLAGVASLSNAPPELAPKYEKGFGQALGCRVRDGEVEGCRSPPASRWRLHHSGQQRAFIDPGTSPRPSQATGPRGRWALARAAGNICNHSQAGAVTLIPGLPGLVGLGWRWLGALVKFPAPSAATRRRKLGGGESVFPQNKAENTPCANKPSSLPWGAQGFPQASWECS